MEKTKLSLAVTLLSVLLSLGLAFAGVPQTVTCTVAKMAASVASATSTK